MRALRTAVHSLPLALFFLFASGFHVYAEAEGSFGFDIVTLRLPGVILSAAAGDLDGDGKPDLCLFHKPAKESYEKFCSVYFQQEGKLENEPGLQIRLGENVSAVEVEDVDSDGRDELCGFDDGGMMLFRFDPPSSVESRRVLEHRTILPSASRQLASVNWIADVDSDGRMDVLLPVADGIRLLVSGDGLRFVESRTFEIPTRGSVRGEGGQNYISYRLPKIEFSDFDKDGRTDVGAFDIERMDFFLTAGAQVPGRHVTAPLVREFTKDFIAATDFRDLNADGIPDAVLVLMSQKKNLQSEVQIYFGDENFSYGTQPAQVYSGDARLILPVFFDATDDGKMEMLLQDIHVGIGFFLNYFLANRIRVDTELRRLSPEGRYEDNPSVSRAIYIRVSESGTEPARGAGDFNGDGLEDLVVGTAEDRLSFFLADKQTILPRGPSFEFPVPAYGNMTTLDLNSDGRTDLIILYSEKDREGVATLLLSK